MQESLFYLIDKNVIKNNILDAKDNFPLNVDSVIDGRFEFYGLGNDIISVVEKCGINYVLVNSIKDALKLRKYNESINIIVKYLDKEYIFDAILNNIIITLYSYKELDELEELNIKDDCDVFLYINDDIEGFSNLNKISKYLEDNKHLKIKGVYTEIHSKKPFIERANEFNNVVSHISNVSKFIISANSYELNTNFYSKNHYIKNINEIVGLQGNIKYIKRIVKNDMFLGKKSSKDKVYAIVEMPYNLPVKKVYIKNKFYKVIKHFNNKLIIDNADNLKVRTYVEILGGKSNNDIRNFINVNGVHKNYLNGSVIECQKFE